MMDGSSVEFWVGLVSDGFLGLSLRGGISWGEWSFIEMP